MLQRRRERDRHVRVGDALWRHAQRDAAFADAGDQFGGDAAAAVVVVDHQQTAGACHRRAHRVAVERRERAQVDDLGLDAVLRELPSGVQRVMQCRTPAHERDVAAFAHDRGTADVERVAFLRHMHDRARHRAEPAHALQRLVEHEHHRVVVGDRREHQALGVVRVRRHHHLETRHVREARVQALRMLAGIAVTAADRGHQHHRAAHAAAGEVRLLGGEVVDRVEAHAEEVDEHQLHDRPHPRCREADRGTDEAGLGNRRVAHALRSMRGEQSLRRTEHTAELGDVLAHDQHRGIVAHRLRQRLADRLGDRQPARRRVRGTHANTAVSASAASG